MIRPSSPSRKRQPAHPLAIRGTQDHPEPAFAQSVMLLARVVLGHPPPVRRELDHHAQVVGRRAGTGPWSTSTGSRPGRHLGRHRQHLDPEHAVEPEQPDRLRPAAPSLQVGPPLHDQQPHRVHVPLGRLVTAGHVVGQVHPAPASSASRTRARTLRSAFRSTSTATWALGAPASPAAASSFAMVRLSAEPSARPGTDASWPTSASIRSATSSALASSTPEPQRPVHRLGLADHDLAALVGQVDRAVGVGRPQLHAPQHVQVVDQLPLADTERGRCLGQPDHLPADHVGHQGEQPLQPVRTGAGRRARPLIAAVMPALPSAGS